MVDPIVIASICGIVAILSLTIAALAWSFAGICDAIVDMYPEVVCVRNSHYRPPLNFRPTSAKPGQRNPRRPSRFRGIMRGFEQSLVLTPDPAAHREEALWRTNSTT